jgi:galactokinase
MISSFATPGIRDTQEFIASLDSVLDSLRDYWSDYFNSNGDLIVTRAPGRLDLMGGFADYSGSLVLQWPIQSAAQVAIQRRTDQRLRIASQAREPNTRARVFEIDLHELLGMDYASLRARFASEAEHHWAAYVAGSLPVLARERNASFADGADIFINSSVPEGKGVSSSAALEVASMQAVSSAYELEIAAKDLALLCQKVENLIAGAPCGVMDQMTAACGEENDLLELLCQPADLQGTIRLPEELEVWGLDSGIRHSIGGSDYRTVRTAAFMGYRMIASFAGFPARQIDAGHLTVDDRRWNGYLANVSVSEFERDYAARIPERMTGREFLTKYQGITDGVTSVDPAIEYPVLPATRHPIYEHARVNCFAAILKDWRSHNEQARKLGELMHESHDSYSSCGLGSDGTDALVAFVREYPDDLYGAKITGGGSGGAVAVLGRCGASAAVKNVAARYQERTGYQSQIISGSSPGAKVFGHVRLSREVLNENS